MARQVKSLIAQVMVNTHYLSDQVTSFFHQQKILDMDDFGMRMFFWVRQLHCLQTVRHCQPVCLLIHADNVMEEDLEHLLTAHAHRPKSCLLTMLTFTANDPRSTIIEIDNQGVVQIFTSI